MGIRDSRERFETPRWGVTAGGDTLDPDVVEPPESKKNTGWVPASDVPNLQWINWLHNQASLNLEYLERLWLRLWPSSHLLRGQILSAGLVTPGSGLSVDVAFARVFLQGSMYEIPAATGLTLASADPSQPRLDTVVSQLDSGVPEYAVVTGTPSSNPQPPTLSAGQLAHAHVLVGAEATEPSLISDVRLFGNLELDRAQVDRLLEAGDIGDEMLLSADASTKLLKIAGSLVEVDADLDMVNAGRGLLVVDASNNELRLQGGLTRFANVEQKLFDVPHIDFRPNSSSNASDNGVKWNLNTSDFLTAAVRVPNGATINRARLYVNLPPGAQVRFELVRPVKGTVNTAPVVAGIDSPVGGGEQTLMLTPSQVVDQSGFYRLTVHTLAGSPSFHGGDVRYAIQSNPYGLL